MPTSLFLSIASKRSLRRLVTFLLLCFVAGVGVAFMVAKPLTHSPVAPGTRVLLPSTLGSTPTHPRYIHVDCHFLPSSPTARPVVVLEAGAAGFSAMWAPLRTQLHAAGWSTCTWDRPGLGWSTVWPEAPVPARYAEALRYALVQEGAEGPYLWVGHSMGSAFIRHWATRWPALTAGMVWIDPAHPDQFERLPWQARLERNFLLAGVALVEWTHATGLPALIGPPAFLRDPLPAAEQAALAFFAQHVVHLQTTQREVAAWETLVRSEWNRPLPSGIPVGLLSATARSSWTSVNEAWLPLYTEWAQQAPFVTWREAPDADHHTIVLHPQYHALIVDLIDEVWLTRYTPEHLVLLR